MWHLFSFKCLYFYKEMSRIKFVHCMFQSLYNDVYIYMLSRNYKLRVIHFMIFVCALTWEYSEAVHQFFIDFTKTCDSVRREVLYKFSLCLV